MEHKHPKISVIMPVYNAESFLSASITSILNQTFQDFEFLIFNDGSTDDSLKIIESFKDSRIKVINSSENSGQSKNLNHGLEIANGEYSALMHADDISLPRRFERQFHFMEENPDIGVCGTMLKTFGQIETISGRYENHEKIFTTLCFWRNCINHPTVMLRNKMLKEYGIRYREDYPVCEDYALWIDLAGHTRFHNFQEIHLLYRIHETNLSITGYSEQIRLTKEIKLQAIANMGGLSLVEDQDKIDLIYDFFQKTEKDYAEKENEIIRHYIAKIFEHPSIDRQLLVDIIGKARFSFYYP